MSDSLTALPTYARHRLLDGYTRLAMDRATAGAFGDLVVEVEQREYLRILYETALHRGIAASGDQLVWAPWPTDPNQKMPVTVEIRLPGGKITFRCAPDLSRRPEAKP